MDKVGSISKQDQPAISQCRIELEPEKSCVRLHIVGAAVHQHHHGLATTSAGFGKVKRKATLAAAGSPGQQMRATLSNACQPVVEESDSTRYDVASDFAFPHG